MQRVTFKSTGATGVVVSAAQRSGLGYLDGLWYGVTWDDGETTWVHSNSVQTDTQVAEQRAANEREQVQQVFGLTGGELEDTAWVPCYVGTGYDGSHEMHAFTFTYWYQGVPEYVEREFDALPLSYAPTYRTVCRDEMFGDVPERVTDDEGTWQRVARYRTSGETECPLRGRVNITDAPCPLCEENPQSFHGYIYIGDGWAEIVYRLQEPPEVHGELAIQEHVSERGQRYVDTGIPETTYTIEADRDERHRALRMSCDAGHLAVTLPRDRVNEMTLSSHEVASFWLRVWDLLYAADRRVF